MSTDPCPLTFAIVPGATDRHVNPHKWGSPYGLDTARVVVAGRDRSNLLAGVHKQVMHVELALFPVFARTLPVRGVLCFVDGEWGLFSKPFEVDRVLVTWSKKLRERLVEPGPLTPDVRAMIHRRLAEALPPA
jgi:hypothetical protein